MTAKPEEPQRIGSELDLLMSLDPLLMSDQDIDAIIDYERKARLEFELGVKTPKKDKGVTIDIASLIAKMTPAAPSGPSIVRRRL